MSLNLVQRSVRSRNLIIGFRGDYVPLPKPGAHKERARILYDE